MKQQVPKRIYPQKQCLNRKTARTKKQESHNNRSDLQKNQVVRNLRKLESRRHLRAKKSAEKEEAETLLD